MGLDAVELVLAIEDAFGIKIEDSEAEKMRTPRDIVDFVCRKLNVSDSPANYCPTVRAFYRLRAAMVKSGVPRLKVCPGIDIKVLLPGKEGRIRWAQVGRELGVDHLPRLAFPRHWVTKDVTTVTNWLARHQVRALMSAGEPLSRAHVRAIVRTNITDTLGIIQFSDDDDFVRDLGLD
jgi:acyl carrier protein